MVISGPLLALRGIRFGYGAAPILDALDLELHAAERVALVGANGAGKSSLMQLLVGLHRVQAGQVIAFGRECRSEADFRAVRRRAGLLFQDPEDQLFCPTVLEDVAFGPLNLGQSPQQARAIAIQTLATLGLDGFAERITHRLSGGEKRLVSLATVLAMQPEVLLLDEPTNGLDEATERRLVEHLQSLPQAMLLVSHDQRLVERLATRALVLRDGRLHQGVMHRHPHTHSHSHVHVHLPGKGVDHAHPDGALAHPAHPHEVAKP